MCCFFSFVEKSKLATLSHDAHVLSKGEAQAYIRTYVHTTCHEERAHMCSCRHSGVGRELNRIGVPRESVSLGANHQVIQSPTQDFRRQVKVEDRSRAGREGTANGMHDSMAYSVPDGLPSPSSTEAVPRASYNSRLLGGHQQTKRPEVLLHSISMTVHRVSTPLRHGTIKELRMWLVASVCHSVCDWPRQADCCESLRPRAQWGPCNTTSRKRFKSGVCGHITRIDY